MYRTPATLFFVTRSEEAQRFPRRYSREGNRRGKRRWPEQRAKPTRSRVN